MTRVGFTVAFVALALANESSAACGSVGALLKLHILLLPSLEVL